MRMVYNDKLDQLLTEKAQKGEDTSLIEAVIQLYQSLNSGGLDETNVAFPNTSSVPQGSIFSYGGATAPTGYLLCDGTAISRTSYSGLFAVLGTNYGVGDNSTTFNVPDLRGKFPIGISGTTYVRGTAYGSATHTHAGVDHVHGVGWADRDHSHGLGGHYHCGEAYCGHDENCSDFGFSHNDASWGHSHDFCTGGPSGGSDGQSTNHTHGNTDGSDRSLTSGSTSTIPSSQAVNYIIKY